MRMWECSKCGKNLPLDTNNYNIDRRIKRGFRACCKLCDREQQRKYRMTNAYRLAHNRAKRKYNKKPEIRFKQNIRHKTVDKHGHLPKGLEYHHTTIPYEVDKFEIISIAEHNKIHGE